MQDANDDGVVLAKFDATANDEPSHPKLEVQGYPTLYFVTATGEGACCAPACSWLVRGAGSCAAVLGTADMLRWAKRSCPSWAAYSRRVSYQCSSRAVLSPMQCTLQRPAQREGPVTCPLLRRALKEQRLCNSPTGPDCPCLPLPQSTPTTETAARRRCSSSWLDCARLPFAAVYSYDGDRSEKDLFKFITYRRTTEPGPLRTEAAGEGKKGKEGKDAKTEL